MKIAPRVLNSHKTRSQRSTIKTKRRFTNLALLWTWVDAYLLLQTHYLDTVIDGYLIHGINGTLSIQQDGHVDRALSRMVFNNGAALLINALMYCESTGETYPSVYSLTQHYVRNAAFSDTATVLNIL